ncbi:hypothetical protein, variant 1 [Cladophialophora immunda]|nr:hypothetical protein, variant 1 [Cladophialophora immunda]KIW24580.1 hypothetical protein, variant 1 [Cladophialophora immunda]
MLARIAEPLAASSIQSYMFFQLRHFDPSAGPATISAQAGLILSSKTAAHVSTGLFWGRFADSEYGSRKLVLVVGLVSSGVAMLGYGFSESIEAAVAWQVLDGILNSSISMIRCLTAELYPEKRYRVRALTLLPLCASAGMFAGPLLGGFLSSPGGDDGKGRAIRYPYAAPNIAVAAYSFILAALVSLGLEHSRENMQNGGRSIFRRFWNARQMQPPDHLNQGDNANATCTESAPLLHDRLAPHQQSDPIPSSTPDDISPETIQPRRRRPRFRQIWTPNVLSTMLAHFIISGHLGTFSSLWAIFLSTPPGAEENRSPWSFSGGLGMDARGVGVIVTLLGAMSVLSQIIVYPCLHDRFGTVGVWRAALYFFPATYLLAPFSALLASDSATAADRALLYIAVLGVLLLFNAGRTGVAPATSLLINDCTPHPSVRATIHTMGTIVGNLGRSVFPAIILPVYGLGLAVGVAGLGFWALAALAVVACLVSGRVVEGANGKDVSLQE